MIVLSLLNILVFWFRKFQFWLRLKKSQIKVCKFVIFFQIQAVPPYKKILTSFPVWAVHLAQWGNLWGLYALMSYGPKFMAENLGFDIKSSAFLAALPYVFRIMFGAIFGFLGDWIRKNELLTVTQIRKVFTLPCKFCNHTRNIPIIVFM